MAKLPRLSEESYESTSSSSRAPNFSRPRPRSQSYQQPARPTQDRTRSGNVQVQAINAFHEPSRDMPDEPRFSIDSDRTATTSSGNSAGSEFAWDGQTGELKSKRRPGRLEAQRYEPRSRPTTLGTAASRSTTSGSSQLPPSTSSSKATHITKRVSVDQQSERLSLSTNDQVEDTASHHTVSDDGTSGSFEIGDEWRTSDYDTSGLTDKQIRKLIKKGVNPALYAEMQAAKKGKNKWIGPLTGNSFLG